MKRESPPDHSLFHEALQKLVDDKRAQVFAVEAIDEAARSKGGEPARVGALAALNAPAIRRCIERIEAGGGYRYEQTNSDSSRAHRKVAALQDALDYLGFYLGPQARRSRGYYGGPPGKPVAVPLEQATRLAAGCPRTRKLLAGKARTRESWTRDAVRRLQIILGNEFAGTTLAPQGSCLTRPDGLFGTVTLTALKEFMARTEARGVT